MSIYTSRYFPRMPRTRLNLRNFPNATLAYLLMLEHCQPAKLHLIFNVGLTFDEIYYSNFVAQNLVITPPCDFSRFP